MNKMYAKAYWEFSKNNWRKYEDVCENIFIKCYEHYRRWSSLIFVLFAFYFLIYGNFVMSFISFGFVHLHLLYNQIWLRLKAIQYFYQNALYIDEKKDDKQK